MKTNLEVLPFSRAGSYMVLSELNGKFHKVGQAKGLYLRTVHGHAMTPLIAQVIPTKNGIPVKYSSSIEHAALFLKIDGGFIEICYDDCDTMLVRGSGEKIGLSLDFLTNSGAYDYIYEYPANGQMYYMANCYKNNCRYLISSEYGDIVVEQEWEESSSLYSKLHFSGQNGFFFVLKEIETEWDQSWKKYDFEESRTETEQEFNEFYKKMPECPERYADTAWRAAYLNWSSIVKKDGFLTRDAMYMSKNWMTNVWSWDHCFNAIASSYHNPEMAWDQFMIMFDQQDKTGVLPDSINDVHIVWNYCKPPIHGWALRLMMENMELDDEKLRKAYDCLAKWTEWWFRYRDYDNDGLCEYNHGNDSGWDNSTAFSTLPPVATPELQAFLVVQMEVLADIADKLGIETEHKEWSARSKDLLANILENCFKDGLPVVLKSGTHEIIENDSLLPYISIVLGMSLPEENRKKMAEVLASDKFLTAYGYATESPKSQYYRSDGYWRGPIWAPSTMLLLDGLYRCGEKELVREAAERFAAMTTSSGFAENFDALTGEGLRDRAYTWTSSAFLVMTHKYL